MAVKSSFGGWSSKGSSWTKMYTTSFTNKGGKTTSTSKVEGQLTWYDKEWNAIIDKSWSDVGKTVAVNWKKIISPSSQSLDKYIQQYGGLANVEKALNAKWYTLNQWFTGWGSTPSGVSTVQKAQDRLKQEQFNKIKSTPSSTWSTLVQVKTTPEKVDQYVKKYGSIENVEAELKKKWYTLWSDYVINDPKRKVSPGGLIGSDIYETTWAPNTEKWLDKGAVELEQFEDLQAKKKSDIIEETAKREQEAVKELNAKKDDRILARERMLNDIFTKYQGETEESKKAIAENLAATKRTQSIAANAAAAQAGQWAGLSEGARQQVESDIANRFAENVNRATGEAISQTQWLTEAQKNAWVTNLNEQDKIDVLINSLTDDEYNVFIKSIQDVWLAKTLAKEEYAKFIRTGINQPRLTEMFNRAQRELKTAQNQDAFKTGNRSTKIELIDSELRDIPGYNNFRTKVIELIDKGLELDDIVATVAGLAQTQFDAFQLTSWISIQDKDLLSKAAKDLSDAELQRLIELRKQQ